MRLREYWSEYLRFYQKSGISRKVSRFFFFIYLLAAVIAGRNGDWWFFAFMLLGVLLDGIQGFKPAQPTQGKP